MIFPLMPLYLWDIGDFPINASIFMGYIDDFPINASILFYIYGI